jgi:predicted MFS family arabinose efflux permease
MILGAEPRSAALPARHLLARRTGRAAGLFWTLAPMCTIALVIGFVGELSILGPNIWLERDAAAGWIIGSSTGLQACGIVASGPLAAYLLARLGSGQVLALAASACFSALAGLATSDTALAIAIYRFVFAIGLGIAVVVSQHVVLVRAPAHAKARTLAVFASFTSIGSALVPAFIHQMQGNLAPVYAAGLVGLLIAMFCGASALRSGRSQPISPAQTWRLASRIGLPSLFSGLVYGVLTNGFSALLAIYAIRLGYSVADASAIVLAGLIGTCVLELPLGWVCDRYRPSRVVGICGAVVIALMLSLLLMPSTWAVMVALAFALGGLCDALYMAGLIDISRMRPAELATGTSCFISACGLGEIAGPVLGGSTLEVFGAPGFIAGFLAVLVAYFAAWLVSHSRSRNSAGAKSTAIAATPPHEIAAAAS